MSAPVLGPVSPAPAAARVCATSPAVVSTPVPAGCSSDASSVTHDGGGDSSVAQSASCTALDAGTPQYTRTTVNT
ncbi:hypothetical protein NDU88_000036 [Pleurodeles waltl]|uniref:Uncharacterized protein n=1 Tax=Pleurodeles waltl TaxID=8319 RepID=A0AAV7SV82_PLEWA|nr:hypothetical protein NDU88_000036 [Pleurodeles waltl]